MASEPEPVAWQDNGERELCRAWAAKLVAKLNTKPDHADDVLWLERLRAALAADPAALLAAEQRGRESAAALLDDMAREADAQAAVSLQLPKRANIQAKANALRAGAAAIRKGDAT